MTSLWIKPLIYALLYLTVNVVHGKHIMTRKFSGSNSTTIDGITCFVCGLDVDQGSPAKHLSDCTNIQTCRPGEFCYLEHIYDMEKGTDYYVGGCRAPDTCHLQTCLKDQYSRRQNHTKLVHCSECCSSSYCNGKLCNLPNDHKLNFTTCYSCENIRDPQKCHTIVDCPPHEICSVEAQAVFTSEPYIRYDLGCKQRTPCKHLTTVNKRQIQLASKCCNTTLCNDHYKDEDHTNHIVRPATFTCPPIANTYAPTLKTTMTTTTIPTTSTTSTTSTTPTSKTKTTTTATRMTSQTISHATGQCRDKPGSGISCTELMSIRGFCTSLIADKYCAESCNHCTNTGHIMTPDPVMTGHVLTTDPVIAGNFLTPDPQTIFGKKW